MLLSHALQLPSKALQLLIQSHSSLGHLRLHNMLKTARPASWSDAAHARPARLQSVLVMYCGVAGLYVAATVVGALHVRCAADGAPS